MEDFRLHNRNLIEFFGKPKKDFRKGDLSIHHPDGIWPVRVPSVTDLALMNVPDSWEKYDSPDNDLLISKYLHHCTEQLVVGRPPWEVPVMYEELRPAIQKFESLLPEYKPATTLTRARGLSVSTPGGNSTATTRIFDFFLNE